MCETGMTDKTGKTDKIGKTGKTNKTSKTGKTSYNECLMNSDVCFCQVRYALDIGHFKFQQKNKCF